METVQTSDSPSTVQTPSKTSPEVPIPQYSYQSGAEGRSSITIGGHTVEQQEGDPRMIETIQEALNRWANGVIAGTTVTIDMQKGQVNVSHPEAISVSTMLSETGFMTVEKAFNAFLESWQTVYRRTPAAIREQTHSLISTLI